MNCITPMIRFYQDKNLLPESERQKVINKEIKLAQKILPREVVMKKMLNDENLITHLERRNQELEKHKSIWRYQAIPCGHCVACRLKYSAEWATRIMCECQKSEHNYFVTLTYDEINLPIAESANYNDTEFQNDGTWRGTLYPKDVEVFINSLRKKLERNNHNGLKYFYCGEYCPTSERPHYHMILMNCPLDIKQFYSFKVDNKTQKLHWKSKELEKLWNKGFIDIGEVEWSSAAYVARYCMKKLTNETDKTIYYSQGKLPEFVRMSRRPGIGAEYFNRNVKEIYKTDNILMKNFHGNTATYKPPKAWDRKFEKEFPEEWEKIKLSRQKAAKRAADLERSITNMTDYQKLENKAENILTKSGQLPREFEYDY